MLGIKKCPEGVRGSKKGGNSSQNATIAAFFQTAIIYRICENRIVPGKYIRLTSED